MEETQEEKLRSCQETEESEVDGRKERKTPFTPPRGRRREKSGARFCYNRVTTLQRTGRSPDDQRLYHTPRARTPPHLRGQADDRTRLQQESQGMADAAALAGRARGLARDPEKHLLARNQAGTRPAPQPLMDQRRPRTDGVLGLLRAEGAGLRRRRRDEQGLRHEDDDGGRGTPQGARQGRQTLPVQRGRNHAHRGLPVGALRTDGLQPHRARRHRHLPERHPLPAAQEKERTRHPAQGAQQPRTRLDRGSPGLGGVPRRVRPLGDGHRRLRRQGQGRTPRPLRTQDKVRDPRKARDHFPGRGRQGPETHHRLRRHEATKKGRHL